MGQKREDTCFLAPPPKRMIRTLALFALVAGAYGSAVELTKENWKSEVVDSGKNAFVKFLAPW